MAFEFKFEPKNDSINLNSKLKQSIELIKFYREPCKMLDNQSAYEALFQLGYILSFTSDELNLNLIFDERIEILYGDLLLHLSNIHSNYDNFQEQISIEKPIENSDPKQRFIHILCIILSSINFCIYKNFKFKQNFQKTNGLRSLFKLLNDDEFVAKTIMVSLEIYNQSKINLIDLIAANIASLSSCSQDYKDIWLYIDSVNILIKMSHKRPSAKEYFYETLTYIADDKQIETLIEISQYVEILIKQLKKTAQDFENGIFNRMETETSLDERESLKIETHSIKDDNNVSNPIQDVFKVLYNLSINEKLKSQIYFDYNIRNDLKTILLKGNDFEKYFCLKLITQLSLSKSIVEDMKNDFEFYDLLNKLISLNDQNDLFKKFCQQIKWNLNVESHTKLANILPSKSNQKHIMISYNASSRELCLAIKDKLESIGYKIWIDVNDIHGSSLDAMAKAIENCFCVLMCVTEKYRQSVNCQAEAQYAFKINKPIIPLIMQKGYESVTGWLGIIMNSKIYINFVKYDFEECCKRLRKEIESNHSNEIDHVAIDDFKPEKMNYEQVNDWLSRNKIDSLLIDYLGKCDGHELKELFEIKQTDRQFYNQSLNYIPNLKLMSIVKFNAALEKLFK